MRHWEAEQVFAICQQSCDTLLGISARTVSPWTKKELQSPPVAHSNDTPLVSDEEDMEEVAGPLGR